MGNNKTVTCALVFLIAIMMSAPWAAIVACPGARAISDTTDLDSVGDLGDVVKVKPVKPGPAPTAGKYAVVVGISNYYGTKYDLQYCDDDARDWSQYLNGKGYTTHVLTDSQATYNAILNEVNWLVTTEKAGNDVAFIYSGHGSSGNMITYELSYLSSATLKSKFSSLESTHAFFCFDACQIGAMKSALGGTGRFVACASTASTYSYDGTSSMANGVFTYWYLNGLQNKGYTSAEQGFAWAESQSEATYPMSCISYDGYTGYMNF